MKKSHGRRTMVYSVGDLIADPVTNTYGIILEVIKVFVDSPSQLSYYYRIEWQDPSMNRWDSRWKHYNICLVQNVNGNGET